LLAVAVGGTAGGLLRLLPLAAWSAAPLPTLLGLNALGSCLIGLVLAFSEPGRRHRMPSVLSLGLMAGFCGGLTTFSTFSLVTLRMALPAAVLHVIVSLALWLAAAALGLYVGRHLNPARKTRRTSP
jgi:CrcB protein